MSVFSQDDVSVGFFVQGASRDGVQVKGEVVELTPEGAAPGVYVKDREEVRHLVPVEYLTEVHRPLSLIAQDIVKDWGDKLHRHHPARPYVEAMSTLGSMDEMYGAEDAKGIVRYFLVNASGWRGEVARYVKAELKRMVEVK